MLSLRSSRRRLSSLTAPASLPFRTLSRSSSSVGTIVPYAHAAQAMTVSMSLAFLLRVVRTKRIAAAVVVTDRHLRRLTTVYGLLDVSMPRPTISWRARPLKLSINNAALLACGIVCTVASKPLASATHSYTVASPGFCGCPRKLTK